MASKTYNNTTNLSLYRNKDFLLLLQGKFVSNLGNAIHRVAVIWYIINLVKESESGLYLALFSLCTFVPLIIFGPLSGVYVDRLNRKYILVGTDIISGILILVLALLTKNNIFPFLSLLIISSLCSIFGSFFNPAAEAILPTIVSSKNLIKANSYNGIIFRLTLILGAGLAGFMYHWFGIIGIFYLNGISFVISGITEMFINVPHLKTAKEKKHFWNEFKEGLIFIKNDRTLSIMLSYSLLATLLIAPIFTILLPLIIKFTLKLTVINLGQFESIASIGALVGMFIISKIPNSKKMYKNLFSSCIIIRPLMLCIFGCMILPFFTQSQSNTFNVFYVLCLIMFLIMVICPIIQVPIQTSFQKRTPDKLRGRFFSIFASGMACTIPLGTTIAGFIVDYFHFSSIIIFVASIEVVLVIIVIYLLNFDDLFGFADKKE